MNKLRTAPAAALTLALALALAGCSVSPEEHLARGRNAYAAHDYAAARVELTAVVQERPEDAAALDLLARTYLALADGESAATTLDRLDRLRKAPADARLLRGEAHVLAGKHDAALADVAGLASAEALRIRALALLGKGDVAGASAAYAAGETAPGSRARLLADYAHLQLARGDRVEARRLAALAAQGRPRPLESWLASADVAAADNRLGPALALFDGALKAFPQSEAAALGKIRVLDGLGRTEEARPLIAAGLAENADDPVYITLDARLDALAGKWDKVRDKLQAHEDALDSAPEANALYAKALLELGQGEQARARLSSQLLRNPNDRRTRALLGQTKLALGDAADAVATLRPLAALPDATPEELGLLAQAARKAGDPGTTAFAASSRAALGRELVGKLAMADRALREKDWADAIRGYEAILARTDGKNALVLNNLAFAYGQSGQPDKALATAEKALKLAPDNASIMDTTGWLLHRAGKDRSRALALLREAVRKAPQNATIAGHLAEAERG